ncbi:glycerol-3-phosphate 1-O-acyltransferase PlsY ['Fragaria x ananassa' phyllody phytoplasma]|uniref:Glycerol-3-phosphate acyltransferase n=1 Tax='Fragaria x ananassa' phyllody phytoplasma TaxID=2358428 RepID=A0ABS5K3F8_9MOLU|nr:glycerol-3-phosphate 1-O-acyltransferase PlsY ['Fragaria x ananassa' phyllody phytoplasma]MBS2126437.1 glycerol-3-phosphate 1-O-acyltransferase PlsY ['Fragaria x ananassa' phyllody phytoplasma]
MDNLKIITLFILFYLLGSIPSGLIIGKIVQKKDLRYAGSGNIGATNASRILGKKWGILVFIFDFLKGFFPAIICLKSDYFENYHWPFNDKDITISLLMITPIIGHMFSLFNRFKGGKAIATSVGVITAINPLIGFYGITLFLIFLKLSGYASLSALITTILINLLLWINLYLKITSINNYNNTNYINEVTLYIAMGIVTLIIILKHHSNIIRLWQGKENKFCNINKPNKLK